MCLKYPALNRSASFKYSLASVRVLPEPAEDRYMEKSAGKNIVVYIFDLQINQESPSV